MGPNWARPRRREARSYHDAYGAYTGTIRGDGGRRVVTRRTFMIAAFRGTSGIAIGVMLAACGPAIPAPGTGSPPTPAVSAPTAPAQPTVASAPTSAPAPNAAAAP